MTFGWAASAAASELRGVILGRFAAGSAIAPIWDRVVVVVELGVYTRQQRVVVGLGTSTLGLARMGYRLYTVLYNGADSYYYLFSHLV